jgi:hypothetical protein
MLDANLESYENMRQNLEANEIDPDEIPVVLQYNKRDLPNALPIEILNERMNPLNAPFYEAVAVKGVGVEDTLKAVTKLVFKALSVKYGDGAQAPAVPGRAPGPPRSVPPAKPPTPPPAAPSHDDLLSELELGTPAPLEESFDVDGNTPVGSPSPAALRAALTPRPPIGTPLPKPQPAPPAPAPAPAPAPRLPPASTATPSTATRAPVASQKPQTTLVGKNDEAAALRRAIGAPGMPSEEIEMDLEEIQELDHPTHGKVVTSRSIETVAPEPVLQPDAAMLHAEAMVLHPDAAVLHHNPETTEVEVPIDIEVAPGTSRVSLNVRLVLNLRKR